MNINKFIETVKAYDCKCALCEWQATKEMIILDDGKVFIARGNELHHITPISEGGGDTADNLILLCPNHHKQAHMGLIERETLQKHTRALEPTENRPQQQSDRVRAEIVRAITFC